MNCLIIDDNIIARTTLKQLVSQDESLNLIAECPDATEAYREILSHDIDLLLLDIEMPGMSGIDLAKSLGSKTPLIIFTTSKKDYAAEAFDLHVVDFITKPVMPVRFLQSIAIAKDIYKSRTQTQAVEMNEAEVLFFRDSSIIRRIKTDEILFAEAKGDYVRLYTTDKVHAVHSTLKAVEEKLPASRFLRVHRSFIVQINKIDSIEGSTLVIHKQFVPVADSYRSSLNKRLNIL